MGFVYRVVDLRASGLDVETTIEGVSSPEEAARQVLGIGVARGGARKDLVAQVYWQQGGQPANMVRLYQLETP